MDARIVRVGHSSPTVIGRYALFDKIASGGMASVHYGRLIGDSGFSRTVAIKRLHPHLAQDPDFSIGFRDEARVAARIRHPNVVPTLDVVSTDEELFIVMEYVHGEALNRLIRAAVKRGERVPPPIAAALIVGVLHGLHAAHEATGEDGAPLHVVHRDVSPQNILVGIDGIPRLVDFGVAKAAGRAHSTREGTIKGKVAYMAPEQIRGAAATRLMDIYGSAVVCWEMLTGARLFDADNDVTVLERAMNMTVEAPSKLVPSLSAALDSVVLRGLERDPDKRFRTAKEMARALEDATPIASNSRVGEWVETVAGDSLAKRAAKVAEIESGSTAKAAPPSSPSKPTTSRTEHTISTAPLHLASREVRPPPAFEAEDPATIEQPLQTPASVPSRVERSAALSKPPVVIGASFPPPADPATAATGDVSRVVPARDYRVVVGVVVAVLGLFSIVAVGLAVHRSRSRVDATIAPASAAIVPTSVSALPSTEIPLAETASTEVPSAVATAAAEIPTGTSMPPTASATSAPGPTASESPTSTAKTHATAAAAASETIHSPKPASGVAHTAPTPVKTGCTPPYTIDANGTKRYKVECF